MALCKLAAMSEQTNKHTSDESPEAPAEATAQPGGDERQTQDIRDAEAAALGTLEQEPAASEELAAAGGAEDAEVKLLRAEQAMAALEADKARLEQEKQDYWNRVLRATADLENARKRAKRDVDEARMDAQSKVLREMLPVIDNLERALEHAEKTGAMEDKEASAVVEGVKLVLRQFSQALERLGVKALDAVGKPFDPNVHEAIGQLESTEHPPGAVVQALQKGYLIGERLLRPALVMVAKAPPAPEPEPEPDVGSTDPDESASGENQDSAADG